MKKFISRLFLLAGLAFLTACSTLDHSAPPTVSSKAQWVVLPFANHTETPLAAGRAEAIAESLLRANGIGKLRRYPASLQQEALFETGERKPFEASLEWARKEGARYALTGSVDEWRYKVGVDGEPAVERSDALIAEPRFKVDYVLANPPFGKKSSMTIDRKSVV